MSILAELWAFLRVRKKYWLAPIVLMLLVFGGLIILAQGFGGRAIHLHAVLAGAACAFSGISAFYHDSAAALLVDGRIVAAAQEERFTRKKQDARFPRNAIAYCLAKPACTLDDVDHVVFYEKPFLKFERLLETYVAFAPRGFARSRWRCRSGSARSCSRRI